VTQSKFVLDLPRDVPKQTPALGKNRRLAVLVGIFLIILGILFFVRR
jgi:uncharacterized membrane protein HdeD (DUF308 family)